MPPSTSPSAPLAPDAGLTYPFADSLPALGATLEVAPGVRWVRMALPFALDHVNLWLLRDELDGQPGWTIVDCGIANDGTRAAWEHIFANELQGLPVLRVIATHLHPDHIGNASWLTQRWSAAGRDCRLWASAGDFFCGHFLINRSGAFGGERSAAFFSAHGLTDPASIEKIRQRGNYYGSMVPELPTSFARLTEGQRLRIGGHDWVCIEGRGHSPEHISLHSSSLGVLISGDMLLPRISTNVSVSDLEPEADPLAQYLSALAHLRSLPADTLVLPSHGKPFVGVHERVAHLVAHHDERLADTLAACRAAPTSAADLLPVLFKRALDLHQTTFAMGEAVAHLHRLWFAGQLSRQQDADGVWRFSVR